jgi:hypothetical protein
VVPSKDKPSTIPKAALEVRVASCFPWGKIKVIKIDLLAGNIFSILANNNIFA